MRMATQTITIDIENDEGVIEVIKSDPCCIKGCQEFATKNMCTLGMCENHYNQARD